MLHPEARVERPEIERMLGPISHRGPDGTGIHLDGCAGLGHCRLAIIDLSTGDQPMCNEDASVWLVFNGEIYNYRDLRKVLIGKGHTFRSKSDTEVIIHAYEEFGDDCVSHLRGMFAFAIWDSKRRRLFVARDRVGIKPLYYCQTKNAFYFGSELKSIIADESIARDVNLVALRRFLSFNYLPGEETMLKGILKLSPGHTLSVADGKVAIRRYWDLRFSRERWSIRYEDAVEELRELLASTVRDHMIADVPVGVLLSGGVDSSAVLGYAVKGTDKQVASFTVGFDGDQVVDERPYARMAAERFGTKHFETTISAEDFWNFLPSYVWHMEEPVCEPPAVALYYVSKLARRHVKVLLSGEGGDEVFAGYPNYPNMLKLARLRDALGPLARLVGGAAAWAGAAFGDVRVQRYGYALGRSLGDHYFSRTSGPTALFNRSAQPLLARDFYESTSEFSASREVKALMGNDDGELLLDQMLYVDTKTWLPDDLLIKADKITMANSIELRVPLLDHKVLEFAASLPADFKVRNGETKRVLKSAFEGSVPEAILNRRKVGFPVPYEGWLCNQLYDRVKSCLLSEKAVRRGYFDRAELAKWLEESPQRPAYSKEFFVLLVTELWHQRFVDQSSSVKPGYV